MLKVQVVDNSRVRVVFAREQKEKLFVGLDVNCIKFEILNASLHQSFLFM